MTKENLDRFDYRKINQQQQANNHFKQNQRANKPLEKHLQQI